MDQNLYHNIRLPSAIHQDRDKFLKECEWSFVEAVKKQNLEMVTEISQHAFDLRLSTDNHLHILQTLMNNYADDDLAEKIYFITTKHEPIDSGINAKFRIAKHKHYFNFLKTISQHHGKVQEELVRLLNKKEHHFTTFIKISYFAPLFEKKSLEEEYHSPIIDRILKRYKNFCGSFLISVILMYGINLELPWNGQGEETIYEHIKNDAHATRNYVIFNEVESWKEHRAAQLAYEEKQSTISL